MVLTFNGLSLVGPSGTVPVSLSGGAITTDVLSLDGLAQVLAEADLPGGSYTAVQLSIASPGTVTFSDGSTASLPVTSQQLVLGATGLDVVVGQSLLVKVDLDLGSSVKLGANGTDSFLCPTGSATTGQAASTSLDGSTNLGRTLGTIQAIGASTFTLQTGAGALSCYGGATTVFVHGDGSPATVADLQVGGAVTVQGALDPTGQLQATSVVIEGSLAAPTSVSGVLTALDSAAGTFTLVSASGSLAMTLAPGVAVTEAGQSLSSADLTNGQLVTVLGPSSGGTTVANAIDIAEEAFFAYIAVDSPTGVGTVAVAGLSFGDSKCGGRLALAGVTLAPARTINVQLGGANVVDPSGAAIPVTGLLGGRLVRVLGRLEPHVPDSSDPNPCVVVGRRIIGMPLEALHGTVQSVDTASSTFVVAFAATENLACDATGNAVGVAVPASVGAGTHFLGGLVFDATLAGVAVTLEGSFQHAGAWQLSPLAVQPTFPTPSVSGQTITSSTSSVVYVIDVSGSMGWDMGQYSLPDGTPAVGDRLDRVKSQVVQSIQSLPPGFQFQVMSHDCGQYFWQTGLVAATDATRTDACQWVANLQPLGATGTGPAVVAALGFQPNNLIVLFTDGGANCGAGDGSGDDACLAAHRQLILTANTQGTVIDVFEVNPSGGSADAFCQGIASDNGGTYGTIP